MGALWFGGLIVVSGLIAVVVWLVVRPTPTRTLTPSSPEETLARRYASGEIDTEEFERRRAVLRE